MSNDNNELSTAKYSAEFIVKGDDSTKVKALTKPFLIPIYQRLYTWEAQHVECLLRDLWETYKQSANSEYFIGAVVVSPNKNQALELIDGQQRMTTLWLIASVLVTKESTLESKNLNLWKSFMALGADSSVARLDFSGRENDKAALQGFIEKWYCHCGDNSCGVECNGWLKNEAMLIARSSIIRFFNRGHTDEQAVSTDIQGFSDYIWSKATFVITQLHTDTDKNRFFDTMNSRGIQLEKHEILKAKLLNGIDEPLRLIYAKVWDLCADINGYVRSDLQKKEKLNYGLDLLDEEGIKKEFTPESNTNEAENGRTLEDILKANATLGKLETGETKQAKEYRSVVSFPVFLLHVLRLFVPDASEKISLDDKKLISQFESHLSFSDKNKCKRFIEFLLECRLLLDNFVIKGHIDEGNEFARWEIWSHLAGTDETKREKRTGKDWNSITMLQTMMYFSQDTTRAPWLTEVLKGLRNKDHVVTDTNGSLFLEQLNQQDKTYAQNRFSEFTLEQVVGADKFKGLGTGVPHYWFYKLEYCLWELWFNQSPSENPLEIAITYPKPNILKKTDTGNLIATFRMRYVTSIEHISPQSQSNGEVTMEKLDRFGNLALISVSANSSYSDKDPLVKASEFELKLNKGMIESLKLAHIFDYQQWGDIEMVKHETQMLEILKAFHPELAANNNSAGTAF